MFSDINIYSPQLIPLNNCVIREVQEKHGAQKIQEVDIKQIADVHELLCVGSLGFALGSLRMYTRIK